MEKYTMIIRPDKISEKLSHSAREILHCHGMVEDTENPHTIIVIGGDGTYLRAVHQYIDHLDSVRFFGIHTGTLGFCSDYKDKELEDFLNVLIHNTGKEEPFPLLQASVEAKTWYGLNEIRIENVSRTQVLDVSINEDSLETFRGSGMCICTQLGSTAYNRSLGGAVIQEGLDLIEMTEIAGIHHSQYRSLDAPLVLRGDSVLQFKSSSFKGAVLGADQFVDSLDCYKEITVRICPDKKVYILRGKTVSYFDRLKSLF